MALDDRRRALHHSLRVSTWRGDQRVAVLVPSPERPPPSASAVAQELADLARSGVHRVLTGALHQRELGPFLANGFVEHDRLHLLRHDLSPVPDARPGSVRLRRAWPRDRDRVLDIDRRAFDDFWTLDRRGLDDAVRATPTSRFRVAAPRGGPIEGYAVTGRAQDRGYLQRLAVDPDRHGHGIGRTLVVDALTWLRQGGTRMCLVNTQVANETAYHLYRSLGFVPEPDGLTVLVLDLGTTAFPTGP